MTSNIEQWLAANGIKSEATGAKGETSLWDVNRSITHEHVTGRRPETPPTFEELEGEALAEQGEVPSYEDLEAEMHAIEAAGDRAQTERDERWKHEARAAMEREAAPRAPGGGYENAPATRMLATYCGACARPLVDARSVEIGLGPDCRRRHGYSAAMEAATEVERQRANKLVYQVALDQKGPGVVRAAEELRTIGFGRLADRILERCVAIEIKAEGDRLAVRTPFSEQAVALFRGIPNRRWDGERKVNLVPEAERRTLWQVLERAFPGAVGLGPQGPFVVPGAAREAA